MLRWIVAGFLMLALWVRASAADADGTHAGAAVPHAVASAGHGDSNAHESHGLPPAAPVVLDLGFFKVTNSMLVTWGVALFIIVFARMATSRIQAVPTGKQNFWEWMVESLHNFLGGIIGGELVSKTFWFFATVFIFILFTNWFGLIPGVGTIGWGTPHEAGSRAMEHVTRPLLRGGNADLNMTSAMAIIFFVCWTIWALQSNGVGGFFSHIFAYKGSATGFLKVFLIAVFLAVGVLEVISILFRPVSLSFRLFGNIFAGENLLESMATMGGKWFGWLVPLPFYGMELIVGLVQALVFTLLTAIFTSLICAHHGDDHAEHREGHDDHGQGHKSGAH